MRESRDLIKLMAASKDFLLLAVVALIRRDIADGAVSTSGIVPVYEALDPTLRRTVVGSQGSGGGCLRTG
jgi:hypothetical protein